MGIKDNVAAIGSNVKTKAQSSLLLFVLISMRIITGFFLGLTLALIGQELTGFGSFSLVFLTLVIGSLFFKISTQWNITKLLVFDLICALVIQLLKMYILVAP